MNDEPGMIFRTRYIKVNKRVGTKVFICDQNTTFVAEYDENGQLKAAKIIINKQTRKTVSDVILIHKIDNDDGFSYMKMVRSDYKLCEDENVVCDYDREWH